MKAKQLAGILLLFPEVDVNIVSLDGSIYEDIDSISFLSISGSWRISFIFWTNSSLERFEIGFSLGASLPATITMVSSVQENI